MDASDSDGSNRSVVRIRIWYVALAVLFGIFAVRLFYLQIIKHDTYAKQALSGQMREYEVDADRGTIYAQLGDNTVPLVVNQKLYTIYADPSVIKRPEKVAADIAPLIGSSES